MSVTFEVSAVAKPEASARKRPGTALDAIRLRVGPNMQAGAANLEGLLATKLHPFVQAAHRAFQDHVALEISPDDVWLCIAQAFAHHVHTHAEELRGRFVKHAGKAQIVVVRDQFVWGSADNDWPGVFGELSSAIAEHIGKQRDLVVADFSTTGPVERAATEVVLMSAMQQYFEYVVLTRCGIPQITLHGTPADWRSIQQRAAVLAEYGLESWAGDLAPILEQLCESAAGRPDRAMWESFYKFRSGSGGDRATGWINVLFPYLHSATSGELEPNPYVRSWRAGHGPPPNTFPSGLSSASFIWEYLGRKLPMEFVAGFVGVSQDPATLGVRPAIGWAVRDAIKK
jgi:Domain of unknown function (DUF4419)